MEQNQAAKTDPAFRGARQSDLKKSFKLAVSSLLTSCSREEFSKAFRSFTNLEQDSLHKLFIQVITSLHENIEDEFESLFLETQVGTALDTVEQLVEEQGLNPLSSDKTNVNDVVRGLQVLKENEIQYLKGMLEKVEDQNRLTQARVEVLRKERKEAVGSTDACDKNLQRVAWQYLKYGVNAHKTDQFYGQASDTCSRLTAGAHLMSD